VHRRSLEPNDVAWCVGAAHPEHPN
jgi:hypothetical protein